MRRRNEVQQELKYRERDEIAIERLRHNLRYKRSSPNHPIASDGGRGRTRTCDLLRVKQAL
jgi:hypothetical protein